MNMHAVVLPSVGPPEVLRFLERPRPTPGRGMVLVEMRATTVSPLDCQERAGQVSRLIPGGRPEILGHDVCGIIAAIGTILQPKKDPKEECLNRYVECMDTNFAAKDGPVKGTSRCAWCQKVCNDNNGVWPLTVQATVGTRSCQYPGWFRP